MSDCDCDENWTCNEHLFRLRINVKRPQDMMTVREAARQRKPIDGVDAQALEGALVMTERERDDALANLKLRTTEVERLRSGRLAAMLIAAESKGPYGPRRRIVEFGDVFDTLECGHRLPVVHYKSAKRHCPECLKSTK